MKKQAWQVRAGSNTRLAPGGTWPSSEADGVLSTSSVVQDRPEAVWVRQTRPGRYPQADLGAPGGFATRFCDWLSGSPISTWTQPTASATPPR